MSLTRDRLLAQAAYIRQQANIFCVDTATLLRREGETIVDGESTPVWSAPVTIKCRIINRSGASRSNVAAQFRATRITFYDSTHRVQLEWGTEISIADRIEYTDTVTGTVRVLEVTYVPPMHDFMGAFIVGCEEVQ